MSVFDLMREKYFSYLAGDISLDPWDPDIKAKIEDIDSCTFRYWSTMNKNENRDSIWNDMRISREDGGLGTYSITNTYMRLAEMARSFNTKGSAFFMKNDLKSDIIDAMSWLYSNIYNENIDEWGNWWDWDIGSPLQIQTVLALMYDHLPDKMLDNYHNVIIKHTENPPPPSKGDANAMWRTFNYVIDAILMNISHNLKIAKDNIENVIVQYSNVGENGFHRDGSYVFHHGYAYTGSYAVSFLEGISKLSYIVEGTEFQISEETKGILYRWIINSFVPVIYDGAMMDMVRGRAISRETEKSHMIGHTAIRSIYLLSEVMKGEEAQKLKQLVKYWTFRDNYRSIYEGSDVINNNNSVFFIGKIKSFISDPSVINMDEIVLYRHFINMDRVVQFRPGYCFAICMHSNRVANYEGWNGTNIRGWHTSDGMYYLYMASDGGHIDDDFWATVDSYRLPGTTVLEETTAEPGQKPQGAWAGGTGIADLYGAVVMHLNTSGQTLKAKKSWFMFDDEIVAMGSGINACEQKRAETIIENRRVENNVFVEYDMKWVHLNDVENQVSIGYYFPESSKAAGFIDHRTGSWRDINHNPLMASDIMRRNDFFTLYIDHGVDPVDSSYSYVLLPDRTKEEVEKYAKNPDIHILENSVNTHAVYESNLNIVAANFLENKVSKIMLNDELFMTCDSIASVMVMENNDCIEVSVSDPTWMNTGHINIEICKKGYSIKFSDPEITVAQSDPHIKFRANVQNAHGRSFKAIFEKS